MTTNHYLKAIHETDRKEQLKAFHFFVEEELRASWERLNDLQERDGSIPDDVVEQWSYEKGRLDLLRLWHGMVIQALFASGASLEGYEGEV